MVEGPPPTAPERPKGRLPRITRYMALAIYYEELIRQGHLHDYAEIATLGTSLVPGNSNYELKVAGTGPTRANPLF